ncbi:hypothetical protein E1B28_003539 [Marasmius oreades]|uniref:Fungal-type protein kinase domain-containing protein n=1 Tax=Marasmius oreades TaxID=181124 RepID=A0A9P7RME8_9AGAR|nr:uncharacterized protein E1B28_003539 [Marasmius oreades]KAG7086017.1 hypothetical protein E1B28_003539 [Marasmius oreades]
MSSRKAISEKRAIVDDPPATGSFDTEIRWNGCRTSNGTRQNGSLSRQSESRKRMISKHQHTYTITLGEVTANLAKFRSAWEVARAMRDSLEAHHDLYVHANIVHGYINFDTMSIVEDTKRGALKDWDMPLSKLHIDISGPVDELFSEGKRKGKEVDRDLLMERVQGGLATLNEQSLSLMREQGIPTADPDIDRGEQLRRPMVRKPPGFALDSLSSASEDGLLEY